MAGKMPGWKVGVLSVGAFLVVGGLCILGAVGLGRTGPVGFAVVAGLVIAAWVMVSAGRARLRWRFAVGGDQRTAERVARGEGLSLDELAARVGTRADELRRTTPVYRRVQIPKKRGGFRNLDIPDDATKALQRRLLRRLFAGLMAHPAATGFERGRTIVDNAAPHANRHVVIRMDVVNFFP